MDINSVTLVGNLTRDAETFEGKTKVCKFDLANNDYKKNVHYFKVVCFGKTAEICANLQKGMKVGVQGSLAYNKWTDKNGQNRSDVSIIARVIQFLDKKKTQPEKYELDENDDMIPF
jgi:single-strand DNA-binding protein